jgi:ryanodine receptor 2
MSERIAERKKFLEESGNQENIQLDHPLPESEDDEDYIDTGAAILNFYCTLVDLLGRCAPDSSVISLVRLVYVYNGCFVKFCFNYIYIFYLKY